MYVPVKRYTRRTPLGALLTSLVRASLEILRAVEYNLYSSAVLGKVDLNQSQQLVKGTSQFLGIDGITPLASHVRSHYFQRFLLKYPSEIVV